MEGGGVGGKRGQLIKGGCTYPDPLFFLSSTLSWVCPFESLPSLSFTSLDMRQPYSKPYSNKKIIVSNNFNNQLTLYGKLLTNIHHKQICGSNISCAIKK